MFPHLESSINQLKDQPAWIIILVVGTALVGVIGKYLTQILSVIKLSKTRALSAKVDMTANIQWLGTHEDSHIASLEVTIVNRGAVRLYIHSLEFALRAIYNDSPLSKADHDIHPRLAEQLFFPEVIIENGSLFPKEWKYAWVDPGCSDVYRYPCAVPYRAKFVMLWVKLRYPDEIDDFQNEQYFCAAPRIDIPTEKQSAPPQSIASWG